MYDLSFSRRWLWRMPFSGMWRRVVPVWTDVSEERIASIFRVEACSHLSRWFLARGFFTLKMEKIRSSETSVHTRTIRLHILKRHSSILWTIAACYRESFTFFCKFDFSEATSDVTGVNTLVITPFWLFSNSRSLWDKEWRFYKPLYLSEILKVADSYEIEIWLLLTYSSKAVSD
jgi:hypothetical protein